MIDEKLNNLRKNYIKVKPTEFLVKNGWDDLRVKIASEEELEREEVESLNKKPGYLSGLIFASLLLLVLIPTVSFAQGANEGDFLYPVKVLSDQVVSKITNKADKPKSNIQTKNEVKDPIKDTIKEASNGAKKIQENIQKKIEKDVKGIQTKLNPSSSNKNKSNSGTVQKKTPQEKNNQNSPTKNDSSSSQNKDNSQNSGNNNLNQDNQGQGADKKK